MTAPATPSKSLKAELISWAKAIGVALVIWTFLRSYLVEAFRIPSPSMENTLLVGDFLFVNKAAYGGELHIPLTGIRLIHIGGYSEPPRNSIVIFRSVEDSTPNLDVVKRLIGVPGDTPQMVSDTLIRNGERLDETYALHLGLPDAAPVSPIERERIEQMRTRQLPHFVGTHAESYHPTSHNWGPIVVPADSFWVMGDNRDESYDSRYWGFLPRSHVEGRPLIIYFSVAQNPFRIRWNRVFHHPK